MKRGLFILVVITFTCLCALLFQIFYNGAKIDAIMNLNEIQLIEAKQAARGLEIFFTNRTNSLKALSKIDDVINNNADGKKDINIFYEVHKSQILAITRIDEYGKIIYNFPSGDKIIGKDISGQNHVQELIQYKKPVVSDVFQSIQGVSAIAIHIPVFKGSEFKGSIGILINFESLAKNYLEAVKNGKTGNALIISRNGTIIYSPTSGLIGKSVYNDIKDNASLLPIIKKMQLGNTGTAEYMSNKIINKTVYNDKKHVVYMPIHIGDTFWSIYVSTSEDDLLSNLKLFRNKLLFIMVIIFIFGIVFSNYGINAIIILKEEDKRKKVEEELRKSESRFRNIFNNLQDAYFETNLDGTFKFASPSTLRLYGYDSMDEIIGKSATNVYANAKDRTKLLKKLDQKGKAVDYVCEAKRKDGSKFWISMNVQFRYNENDQVSGTVGLVRDITERKLVEEELKNSEAKYRNIYDNAVEGMYRNTIEGKALEANNALAKILGYESPEDIVKNVIDSAHQTWLTPADRQKFVEILEENDVVFGYECQFKRTDGQVIWVSLNSKLVRDENGKAIYTEGFMQDITERKNKELDIESKMKQLQWHYDIAMQRELKMVELKKEVNELLVKAGEEKRYG